MVSVRKDTYNLSFGFLSGKGDKPQTQVYKEFMMKKHLFFIFACTLTSVSLQAQEQSCPECECQVQARPVYLNPQIYENSRVYDTYDIESSRVRGAYPGNHDSSFYDYLTR